MYLATDSLFIITTTIAYCNCWKLISFCSRIKLLSWGVKWKHQVDCYRNGKSKSLSFSFLEGVELMEWRVVLVSKLAIKEVLIKWVSTFAWMQYNLEHIYAVQLIHEYLLISFRSKQRKLMRIEALMMPFSLSMKPWKTLGWSYHEKWKIKFRWCNRSGEIHWKNLTSLPRGRNKLFAFFFLHLCLHWLIDNYYFVDQLVS